MQQADKERVELLINKGFQYHQDGHLDDAEPLYEEALKLDDNNARLYNLIGVLKLQQSDPDTAIEYMMKAINLSKSEYYYETLFHAFIKKKDYNRIISYETTVNMLFPKCFSLMFNLGLAYRKLFKFKEALYYYERALRINPMSYEGWNNVAVIYRIQGRAEDASYAMKVCYDLSPDDNTAYYLGIDYMSAKQYDKGLPLFEKRLSKEIAFTSQNKTHPQKIRKDNEWKGEDIKDKDIFIYYEAGFGDLIMFSRYLPLVAKKCRKLTLMCQKPLTPLFKENKHLGIDTIIDSFDPKIELDADVHASILSLPYLLGLKDDNVFETPEGYIVPNMDMVEEYKKKYFQNDKIKVGIKWRGNTTLEKNRVIPAELFNRLTYVDNTQFYSFQTFEGSEDVNKIQNIIDIGKDLTDFAQTAAALRNLDLVICNDTSLAHLAGAMRIPCWIILPYNYDWRWHTDLKHCDWYESVKLFRSAQIGDWQSAFDQVLEEMTPD